MHADTKLLFYSVLVFQVTRLECCRFYPWNESLKQMQKLCTKCNRVGNYTVAHAELFKFHMWPRGEVLKRRILFCRIILIIFLVVNTALYPSRKMLTVGFFHVFKVCSLPLFPKQLFFEVFLEHLCKKKEKLIWDLFSCSVGNGNDRMGGGRKD